VLLHSSVISVRLIANRSAALINYFLSAEARQPLSTASGHVTRISGYCGGAAASGGSDVVLTSSIAGAAAASSRSRLLTSLLPAAVDGTASAPDQIKFDAVSDKTTDRRQSCDNEL